jgi:hypothetical protein
LPATFVWLIKRSRLQNLHAGTGCPPTQICFLASVPLSDEP